MTTSPAERQRRPSHEREADLFAAEVLMPEDALKQRFLDKFGAYEVCVNRLSPEFLARLSVYSGREYDASMLTNGRTLSTVLAEVRSSHSRQDDSLVAAFDVSPVAMAIQLEELGLVSE